MIATLYAILTAPVVFAGAHPALTFVGAGVEFVAVVIALIRLHHRDAQRAGVEPIEPVCPHPGRNCDRTCDVTDDAHDGCVWSAR